MPMVRRCHSIAHMFGSALQRCHNGGHRAREFLVFPEADHAPACSGQRRIGRTVTRDVSPQFRRPVPLVLRRLPAMDRADMPKAAVDVHRDLPRGEDDIRPDLHATYLEAQVLPVPVTLPMKCASKRHFGFGVAPAIRLHIPGAPLVHGRGVEPTLMSLPTGIVRCCQRYLRICLSRWLTIRKGTPSGMHRHHHPTLRKAHE